VVRQRAVTEEESKRRRGLESARRKVADQLRDAGARLTAETATRLNRTLRSADGPDAIKEVAAELDHAVAAVRTIEERRRDREIDRTRERLRRSLPRSADVGARPRAGRTRCAASPSSIRSSGERHLSGGSPA